MRQAECIEKRIYVFHADAVDDDIGCGIVAYGNHERGDVANSEPRHAGSQRACEAASANEIGRLQGVDLGGRRIIKKRMMIELREDGDFDGAGSGKNFSGMRKKFLSGREI